MANRKNPAAGRTPPAKPRTKGPEAAPARRRRTSTPQQVAAAAYAREQKARSKQRFAAAAARKEKALAVAAEPPPKAAPKSAPRKARGTSLPKRYRTKLQITFDPGLLELADKKRGKMNRSRWLEMLVQKAVGA